MGIFKRAIMVFAIFIGAFVVSEQGLCKGNVPWDSYFHSQGGDIISDRTSEKCCFRGVNIPGLEYGQFGDNDYPGVEGTNYFKPSQMAVDQVDSWNFDVVRLPFEWGRLVPGYAGGNFSLDATYVALMDDVVSMAGDKEIYVILDMQDFLKYWDSYDSQVCVDSDALSQELLYATWRKLAEHFADEKTVLGYEIMNEPIVSNDPVEICGCGNWHSIAQNAVDAIRLEDTNHMIFIDGKNYSHSFLWQKENSDSIFVQDIVSPPRIAYAPHVYFDQNMDSAYTEGVPANNWEYYVRDRLVPILDWKLKNNVPIFFTESGIPNGQKWGEVLESVFENYFDPLKISHSYWMYDPNHSPGDEHNIVTTAPSYQLDVLKLHLGGAYSNAQSYYASPQSDSLIYVDSTVLEWKNASWKDETEEIDYYNTSPVRTGACSIEVDFEGSWSGLKFYHEYIDTSPYVHLEFYIHDGGVSGVDFSLFTENVDGEFYEKVDLTAYATLQSNSWNFIIVPLKDIVDPDDPVITSVVFQNKGTPQVAYIDDISLTDNCHIDPVQIDDTLYESIQSAYNNATTGSIIKCLANSDLIEDVVCDLGKSVSLMGGYDCDFSSDNGYSTINGSITIKKGSVVVERIAIEGKTG